MVNPLTTVMNRHPLVVSAAILLIMAGSAAAVTIYVRDVVRPEQEAARVRELAGRTLAAEAMLKRGRFEPAMNEFRALLSEYGERFSPAERGRVYHHIAVSQVGLGLKNGDKDMLNNALGAFRETLALRPADADSAGFAETQLALASLHRTLADRGSVSKSSAGTHLTEAIAAYQAAVAVLSAESQPEAYGRVQRDIGNTYREQYAVEPADALAESAQRAYGAALAVFTKEAFPSQRAATLVEKGVIAMDSGKTAYTRLRTREAIDALEQALALYQKLEDARATKTVYRNLAAAYLQIAETEDRPGVKMKYQFDARRATYLADGASISDKAAVDAGSDRLRSTD